MKYKKFTIHRYKGIRNPITIDFAKNSLIPIIGVNECGKTTILEALLSFDSFNDNNYGNRHLNHIQNLYEVKSERIIISAEIEYIPKELNKDLLNFLHLVMDFDEDEIDPDELIEKNKLKEYLLPEIDLLKKRNTIEIYRCLNNKKYSFTKEKEPSIYENQLCKEIVRMCPYMLYFDDFQDDFNGIIKYKNEQDDNDEDFEDVTKNLWYKIVDNLFEKTNSNFSLRNLIKSGDQRNNIISDVKQHLNSIINEGWINFNLEKGDPPIVNIIPLTNNRLKFEIIEKIKLENGETRDRHFGIKERSKGFFWFFNFIMKLYFNPQKRYKRDKDTIYLLDEPGSYLHSTAQKNLLDQLKNISKDNKVIFTTHSPFLLDPKKIPLKNIRISSKSDIKGIELYNFSTAPKKLGGKNSPFQIVLHYLEITPIALNFNKDKLVIVEGIYDYYWYEMMKGRRKINFFPSNNADSILFHISYMIADSKNYTVLWDNDVPGRKSYKKAKSIYGDEEAKKWCILPLKQKTNMVLENLITTSDKAMLKSELVNPASFKKLVTLLYYNSKRKSILEKLSDETKTNFNDVFNDIELKLNM